MRTLLLVAVTALIALTAPTSLAVPPAKADQGSALPQLTVDDRTITDVEGRTVLLRGVNVNQLAEYADNGTGLATVAPLGDEDFAAMAALGFSVVRLNVSWSLLEPSPGAFDTGYVEKIRSAVRAAKDHGIYTVLDMHQDAWGPSVGTPAGASCPPLLEPGIGWDGAPEWATLTGGWTTCNIGGIREASPAIAHAFQAFYDDRDGIQTRLVETWARLAAEFASEPAVVGYDLLNEPNPGLRDPFTAADQIGRLYQRAIAAIRVAESGGFPHLVFVEPSALWSALGFDALPDPRYLTDPLVVFSPHLYSESITISSEFPSLDEGFEIAERAAARYDAPLWTGEWGWWGDPTDRAADAERFLDAMDRHRIGGAWWSWAQACGDPHVVRDGNTAKAQDNLLRVDCPSGEVGGPVPEVAAVLSRPYPRAVPGELTATTAQGFSGTGSGRVDAWFPGAAEPVLRTAGVTDVVLTRVEGGWRLSAHADGDYEVALGGP